MGKFADAESRDFLRTIKNLQEAPLDITTNTLASGGVATDMIIPGAGKRAVVFHISAMLHSPSASPASLLVQAKSPTDPADTYFNFKCPANSIVHFVRDFNPPWMLPEQHNVRIFRTLTFQELQVTILSVLKPI